MIGKYKLRIEDKKVRFDLVLKRKFTIIKGNSATGKTYLTDMVLDEDGTKIYCKLPVRTLSKQRRTYTIELFTNSNTVFILDEDVEGIDTNEFAELLQESDNYFIICCRDVLKTLPISVDEIYEFKSETFYNNLNVPFTVTSLREQYNEKLANKFIPELMITEDSKSGFQFFDKTLNIECVSALNNANIVNTLIKYSSMYKNICIFLDRAAYGSYVYKLFNVIRFLDCNVVVLAPESFEYILLKSGVVECNKKYLDEPYNYCDVKTFVSEFKDFDLGTKNRLQSWEQYFTALLRYYSGKSAELSYQEYGKSELDPYYFRFKRQIFDLLPDVYLMENK